MSGLDVEALLDSAAASSSEKTSPSHHDRRDDRHFNDRRDHDGRGRGSRDEKHADRGREKTRDDRDDDLDKGMKPTNGEKSNAHGNRRRSHSRDDDRSYSRRYRDTGRDDSYRSAGGDFYRGGGRGRSRSRSPDNRYRPGSGRNSHGRDDRDRYRDRERDRDRRGGVGARRRTPSPANGKTKSSKSPQPNDDERDKRTVFVQQLANRLRTKELIAFFEKVGPVVEAQIVKDRHSGVSKGVGYVEFKNEESVQAALQLTGQKLLGIPIIAQLTDADKNRAARNPSASSGNTNSAPFHRLYVGNIHFSITENDLQNVFEPFGELEYVQLQKEDSGRSKGYGFVQFRDPTQAKEALEKMNGFQLAERPIRVGLGNDKFTNESTATIASKNWQGSAFSGFGGRGAQAGGPGGNFDRAGGRDNEKGAGGASALDDTDVAGVNFNNYSRDALMRKLARTDEPAAEQNGNANRRAAMPQTQARAPATEFNMASKCVVLRNMFDPAREQGQNWVKELEDDVRDECDKQYGVVVHCAVDPNTQGDIYVKFDRVQGGENAIKGLNGRFFNGFTITAQPVVEAVYNSLFSRSKIN